MTRPYNIKFNRTHFRRAVIQVWLEVVAMLVVFGGLSALCYWGAWYQGWSVVPFVVFVILALYGLASVFVGAIPDTLEFRRIYGPLFPGGSRRRGETRRGQKPPSSPGTAK